MKILKIFGIVVGIHVFLLVLVFAIPGCSSTTKPAPSVADTASKPATPPPTISVPAMAAPVDTGSTATAVIAFDPNAPAAPAPATAASGNVRFVPTRPDTAVAGALVAQPVDGVTPATTYTVKSGDNLWTIAKKQNLSVAQLTAANGLAANASLRPGQKMIIPSKAVAPMSAATAKTADATSAPAANSGARASDAMKHTVKSGDTLGGIARTYGVKPGDIAVANNISDPAKIRLGMELIIPGWQPTGAKSGKSPAKSGSVPKGTEAKKPASLDLPGITDPSPVAPAPAPVVPVIRIEEGPATPPAPKF